MLSIPRATRSPEPADRWAAGCRSPWPSTTLMVPGRSFQIVAAANPNSARELVLRGCRRLPPMRPLRPCRSRAGRQLWRLVLLQAQCGCGFLRATIRCVLRRAREGSPVHLQWGPGRDGLSATGPSFRLVVHRHIRDEHPSAAALHRRCRRDLEQHAFRRRRHFARGAEVGRGSGVRSDCHADRNRGRHLPARQAR